MTNKLFLPEIHALGPTPPKKPENPEKGMEREGVEKALFAKMVEDSAQGRAEVVWDERLKAAACRRVQSMAQSHWAGHVDPWGHGPDSYVRAEGYILPDYYWVDKLDQRERSNHVESLDFGGLPTEAEAVHAELVWSRFINHEPHRIHLLGLVETFALQTHVGICVWWDRSAPWVWYTSVITAPPSEGEEGA